LLNSIKAELERSNSEGNITTVESDISSPEFTAEVISKLAGRMVGVLAHSAGVSRLNGHDKKIFAINYTATKTIVEALQPTLIPGGSMLLVASVAGNFNIARCGLYHRYRSSN
jgi:short-subunit dehydrogenase